MKVEYIKEAYDPNILGYVPNGNIKIISACGEFVINFTKEGAIVSPNNSYYWSPGNNPKLYEGDKITITL